MKKCEMINAIDEKLGYELIPAWELFTYNEIKIVYDEVIKKGKKVKYNGNIIELVY